VLQPSHAFEPTAARSVHLEEVGMEYVAEAVHQERLRFGVTTSGHAVQTDYPLGPDEVGNGPRPLELLRAVEQSEALVCPVWAMLKPSTKITTSIRFES
jgi:uncharacterized OsmC-like protein